MPNEKEMQTVKPSQIRNTTLVKLETAFWTILAGQPLIVMENGDMLYLFDHFKESDTLGVDSAKELALDLMATRMKVHTVDAHTGDPVQIPHPKIEHHFPLVVPDTVFMHNKDTGKVESISFANVDGVWCVIDAALGAPEGMTDESLVESVLNRSGRSLSDYRGPQKVGKIQVTDEDVERVATLYTPSEQEEITALLDVDLADFPVDVNTAFGALALSRRYVAEGSEKTRELINNPIQSRADSDRHLQNMRHMNTLAIAHTELVTNNPACLVGCHIRFTDLEDSIDEWIQAGLELIENVKETGTLPPDDYEVIYKDLSADNLAHNLSEQFKESIRRFSQNVVNRIRQSSLCDDDFDRLMLYYDAAATGVVPMSSDTLNQLEQVILASAMGQESTFTEEAKEELDYLGIVFTDGTEPDEETQFTVGYDDRHMVVHGRHKPHIV